MNLSPVRTALRHQSDYVCLPCLLRIFSTPRWQQPVRNRVSRVIVPNLSPSVAASLHDTIDQADRAERARVQRLNKVNFDKLRSKNPGPRAPLSKKSQVLQEKPSDPVTAQPKTKSARQKRRAKESREDHADSQRSAIQVKKPKPQDASSKRKASKKGFSASKATKKQKNGRKITDIDSAVTKQPSESLGDSSSRYHLEATTGAEVEELQVGQAQEGAIEASSTGTEHKEVEFMESQGTAESPSDTVLPKQSPADVQIRMNKIRGQQPASEGVQIKKIMGTRLLIKKIKSESPPTSLPEVLRENMVAATETVRHAGAPRNRVLRRVSSESKAPQSVWKTSSGGTEGLIALEERLKEHTRSVPGGKSSKISRKVNAPVVRRTASWRKEKREQEVKKDKPAIQQVNAADLSITGSDN